MHRINYLWELGDLKVHKNALRVLITYLEKATEYNKFIASQELALNAVSDTLTAIEKENPTTLDVLDNKMLHESLADALNNLKGDDAKRKELIKKSSAILIKNA